VECVRIKKKAHVTIPKKIMDSLGLNENDELDVYVQDGKIIMEPMIRIPKDQAWFWTEGWQRAERRADEDLASGRVKAYDSVNDLLADLPDPSGGGESE
jgi:AbrB family looped-hinge helix DNA binding protein